MKKVYHRKVNYSIPERFFIEKIMELLDANTIDTYRSRAMNPRTIIIECSELIKEKLKGRIPSKKAIEYAATEAKQLIEDNGETYLNFSPFSHTTVLSKVGSMLDEKLSKEDLKKVFLTLKNFSFNHNRDYAATLFVSIQKTIKKYNSSTSFIENKDVITELSKLTTYLTTELLYIGYTKKFLYRKVLLFLNEKKTRNFQDAFSRLQKLVTYSSTEYNIIFKLDIPPNVTQYIKELSLQNITIFDNTEELEMYTTGNSHDSVKAFVKSGQNKYYFSVNVDAHDSFEALNKGRIIFSENIDLIHLGYPDANITPTQKILIVSKYNNNGGYYAYVFDYKHELDGSFKDGSELYKQFVEGINNVSKNPNIKADSKEKIKSAIRYLRLGNNAVEVEHKFINYWIAIEYLFSDTVTDNEGSTINKIKKVFPKLHSNIFIKRLIKDFHDNIGRLQLVDKIPTYSPDYLEYLCKKETYDWINDNLASDFPLLVFRGNKISGILFDETQNDKQKTKIEERIFKHKTDLELHLSRMYRIRNSIIHDAAIGKNIISITANLKYYLVFIISHIIKELEENTSLRSIEDLFALEEIIYDSLQKEMFPVDKLLKVNAHFEIID